ncbi:hypothetical protein Tco_0460034 [Tanacetum coccineum]
MTRSSTNELFTPYKEPKREFRSSRRHFKTLSLDELRSLEMDIQKEIQKQPNQARDGKSKVSQSQKSAT